MTVPPGCTDSSSASSVPFLLLSSQGYDVATHFQSRGWYFIQADVGQVGCLSWWQRDPVGTAWSNQVAPQRGQAQGPLIHSTPPLVPTGPWVASTSMDRIPRFGRQHSLGARVVKRGREGLYGRPSSLLHT